MANNIRPARYTESEFLELLTSNKLVLSYSSIKNLVDGTPYSFMSYYTREKTTSPSMMLGSMVDCLFLEPHKFDSKFFVKGNEQLDSKAVQVTLAAYSKACYLVECLKMNRHTKKLIIGEKQASFQTTIKDVPFRGFLDVLNKPFNRITDLKTTSGALTETKLNWTIRDYKYDIQAAIYCTAYDIWNYNLIFINTTSGECQTVDASGIVKYGLDKLDRAIKRYKNLQYGGKHLGIDLFKDNTKTPITL